MVGNPVVAALGRATDAYAPSFDDPSDGPKIPSSCLRTGVASRGPVRRWPASRASFLLIVKPSPGSKKVMESGHGVVGIYQWPAPHAPDG
jgi:hypothetical protein